MNKYDVIIVLGSQLLLKAGRAEATYGTYLRAGAAGIAYRRDLTERFVVSGGYNFGVRYTMDEILMKPDFSFEALVRTRTYPYPSEAGVIRDIMTGPYYHVPLNAILLEELSATTQESALFVKHILSRQKHPDLPGTNPADLKKIGLLTLLYNMPRALNEFRKAELAVEPVYAEDLLALDGEGWAYEVSEYYRTPRGGKRWDADKIYEIMLARARDDTRRTIRELVL